MSRVAVVGSGAGGSVAAMVLAGAHHDVVVFEKGDNWFGDLTEAAPSTVWSNDELKRRRGFGKPDPVAEPRTFRWSIADTSPRYVGSFQPLLQTVGGGTVHWGADTPRYWDIDFRKLSALGPIVGADVADWPFDYEEIAPFYDEIERLIGVAGDVDRLPADPTLAHAPRRGPLPMPAGPPQHSSMLVADGCERMGLHPFPVPMAINSRTYDGRPACNDCGFCSGFGCPIHARVGALAPLRRALRAGAELRPRSWVTKLVVSGRRCRGIEWIDEHGRSHTESFDMVVLGAMAIETVRLALLSQLPDPHETIGRWFMMHWFSDGSGIFTSDEPHAERGRSITHDCDDFADPDFPGARDAAKAAGLPYFRGGTMELGGSQGSLDEADTYRQLLGLTQAHKPFGSAFKQLMRSSILRTRMSSIGMIGEDLPYATNTVDLDPSVRDYQGLPVARITYRPGAHELAAQRFYLPWLAQILREAGAEHVTAISDAAAPEVPIAAGDVPTTQHVMGGMRMGTDPTTSVTDSIGRFHHLDNVVVADGSSFPTSGGHNPTLTIMATALRNARRWS